MMSSGVALDILDLKPKNPRKLQSWTLSSSAPRPASSCEEGSEGLGQPPISEPSSSSFMELDPSSVRPPEADDIMELRELAMELLESVSSTPGNPKASGPRGSGPDPGARTRSSAQPPRPNPAADHQLLSSQDASQVRRRKFNRPPLQMYRQDWGEMDSSAHSAATTTVQTAVSSPVPTSEDEGSVHSWISASPSHSRPMSAMNRQDTILEAESSSPSRTRKRRNRRMLKLLNTDPEPSETEFVIPTYDPIRAPEGQRAGMRGRARWSSESDLQRIEQREQRGKSNWSASPTAERGQAPASRSQTPDLRRCRSPNQDQRRWASQSQSPVAAPRQSQVPSRNSVVLSTQFDEGTASGVGSRRVSVLSSSHSMSSFALSPQHQRRPRSSAGGRTRKLWEPTPSLRGNRPETPGHRDRFAATCTSPGPGAYTPYGFANPGDHPTPPRTMMKPSKQLNALFWTLKEASSKPSPGQYHVLGDAGCTPVSMRCARHRSSPQAAFPVEQRVCSIATGMGSSKHRMIHREPIMYDDVRMTPWRDWH